MGQDIAQTTYSNVREATLECELKPSSHPYVLFVSTFKPNVQRDFVLKVYSKTQLKNTIEDKSTGETQLKQLPANAPIS